MYKPYWPLFLVLIGVFGAMAYGYLKYATPVYEVTAKILIKDEKKGVEEAKTVESLDGFSGKSIIENEIEVIKSPTLIDGVATSLKLYAPVFQKGSFKTISAYNLSPVTIEAQDIEHIEKVHEIPIKFHANKNSVFVSGKEYVMNEFVNTPYGILKFSKNIYQTSQPDSANFYFSLIPLRAISAFVNKSLKVESASKLSTILHLRYNDAVPDRGENIVNALLSAYNSTSLNDKNNLTENTLSFIDERLKLVKKDLDTIERKIQQYKANQDAVDIGTQGKMFLQNVSNNDQKLGEINMQLAVLGQVDTYVTSKGASRGIVPSTLGVNDPTLSLLVNKLYGAELEYESMKKSAGENNPMTQSLKEQIQSIKPGIQENIQGQRRSLEASRNNLMSTNNVFFSTLQAMPEKERQLININREQGIKNQIYNFLLQKREEAALSHAAGVSNNRVIDEARVGENPVSPKKKVIYVSSFLLALVSGMFIVIGKEKMRGKIMFINDIEELTAVPVIGEITEGNRKEQLVVGDGKRTLIAEQFRKIRASFNYLGLNADHKRIMVTSSISGEGKSFVALNLAMSLAMAGKKVALLDFDLNNPSLSNKLNIGPQRGITELLMDECKVEDIILPTDQHKNLFLLPAGELPMNPSELIMNGRAEGLLNDLDERFDNIVIDIAPVGPVTDAYLISPLCDSTLYVVRHGYTPKVFLERIDENNRIHNLKNLAIVFNGVVMRGFGNKNYGYGYGYHTSYGYNKKSKFTRLLPPAKN